HNWRYKLIPDSKGQRVPQPVPPALIPQMPVIIAALTAIGVDVVGREDYEAEDIIASLIPKVEKPIEVWSGDRDLFSQVRGKEIVVLYPEKTGLGVVDEDEVRKRDGIA